MSEIELHAIPLSPPSRSVHLLLKLLKIQHQYITVDLFAGGTRTPEFLAMNPQHTVPVLKHGDFALSESRAILTYLCQSFGGEKLYPVSDPKKAAIVNQRMFFDMGILYRRIVDAVGPVCFGLRPNIPDSDKASVHEAMMWTEQQLATTNYIAGDEMTVADISLLASISTYQACAKGLGPLSKYPGIEKWFQNVKNEVDGYSEVGEPGTQQYKEWFESKFQEETLHVEQDL